MKNFYSYSFIDFAVYLGNSKRDPRQTWDEFWPWKIICKLKDNVNAKVSYSVKVLTQPNWKFIKLWDRK
jgi:hypothetical protein